MGTRLSIVAVVSRSTNPVIPTLLQPRLSLLLCAVLERYKSKFTEIKGKAEARLTGWRGPRGEGGQRGQNKENGEKSFLSLSLRTPVASASD